MPVVCRLFIFIFFVWQLPSLHAGVDQICSSGRFLAARIGTDGSFEYRCNLNPSVAVSDRYNVLRHAGAIYSLRSYWDFEDIVENPLLFSAAYLSDSFIAPVLGSDGVLAVWSDPNITKNNSPFQAKLGGAGLGLVALLSLDEIIPNSTSSETLQGLGRFLFFMQKEDGSFYLKFIPSTGGRNDDWTSLYYPGEAALGLVMLYEYDGQDTWLVTAIKALNYLAESRSGQDRVPADHWALLATARLLQLDDVGDMPIPTKLLEDHALQICRSILSEQLIESHVSEFIGGFSYDGRTTPTATRLEGLLATLEWLPAEHPDYASIEASVHLGLEFLFRAQIKEGEFAGAFTRAVKLAPDWVDGADDFNRRATEVRIDYIQHALSAMIQYHYFLEKTVPNSSGAKELFVKLSSI